MYKQLVFDEVEKQESMIKDSCSFIWNHPETGGNEKESADYFRDLLSKEGFKIVNEPKLPHAFYAEAGEGKPVIAILGEYDALPGLSQKVTDVMEPVEAGGPGHGCGHNILGTASAAAAIAIKNYMNQEKVSGTVRFYGCPEEELLSGKVKMSYYHMFDGCDVAFSWHPMSCNMVYDNAYLASAAGKFHFKGVSAHAAFAPERGRSALDAVELMNVGCNYLREHTLDGSRIHYTTDSYGFPPNIVPDKATAWYCVRSKKFADVLDILERIKRVAQGAAMMTDTEVEFELISGCSDLLSGDTFTNLTYSNMQEADFPKYTRAELEFAKMLQASLPEETVKKEEAMFLSEDVALDLKVQPRDLCKTTPLNSSSDSGDVSRIMPTNLFTVACFPIGVAPHTWQAAAAAGSSIAEKGALYAAKIMAGTAYDLLHKPKVLEQIIKEFEEQKIDYKPMYVEI